jgi:hypothetical protein
LKDPDGERAEIQQPELDETNNITTAGPLTVTSPPPH